MKSKDLGELLRMKILTHDLKDRTRWFRHAKHANDTMQLQQVVLVW